LSFLKAREITLNRRSTYKFYLLAFYGVLFAAGALAQTGERRQLKPDEIPPQYRPPHPAAKMEQRYFQIDAKRMSEDVNGDDALTRSREFKRIDSTYYVGWLFEGAYKFNHAADYLGFKNAIYPLSHALDLLEKDYRKALMTRTPDFLTYFPIYKLQIDYTLIANYLMNCYSNTDQPDQVFKLLQRVKKFNFQNQAYLDVYDYMAWTVHRNRFYTSSKYSFLRNSIAENEALAQRYLDTAMLVIARNKPLNERLQPNVEQAEKLSVYHYRNILYSYAFNIDSAEYYFDLMRKAGRLPHNNYATFKAVSGDFRTAEEEYKIAAQQDNGDHRLQEWAYYTSILHIYKAHPREGMQLARDMIKANGTTPGYGWYNIALARSLMYDGQIAEAERYAQRAAEFKEVHIGTTLGQAHYEFSVQLLKLIGKEHEWSMQQFEHKNWWYNPSVLFTMSGKVAERYTMQYFIINQFAQNPERDRVIYKLFSNESTVSWDEIWYLVHDYSTQYFISRFEREAATDRRPLIRKYFKLFSARLKIKQGKYAEAKRELDALLKDTEIDQEYEKLYIARLFQAEAECAKEQKDKAAQNDWLYKLYITYPQLVPYSGMPMNMILHVSGAEDKEVTDRLKDCNINWVTNSSTPAVNVYISFSGSGDKKNITYSVTDRGGNYVVAKQAFNWKKPEEAAISLAYRLFDIGSKIPGQDRAQ
jgi:hypothetical protein